MIYKNWLIIVINYRTNYINILTNVNIPTPKNVTCEDCSNVGCYKCFNYKCDNCNYGLLCGASISRAKCNCGGDY